MKAFLSRSLVVLGAVLVLGALNAAIVGKERIRRDGDIVYLQLAPVDPRSLIQGDYMALRFALAQQLAGRDDAQTPKPREGEVRYAYVALDEHRVASLATASATAPIRLRYRVRNGQIWLGTNAFFFEEGTAARFTGARYGEFRVDRASGEAVLVGLRGAELGGL